MKAILLYFFISLCGITLADNPQVTGVVSPNNSCNLTDNGAIDITVSGGTSPYEFNWSTGDTTEDISGLSAGFYGVTVTDADGDETSIGFSVELAAPFGLNDLTSYPSCYGEVGTGYVSVSGGQEPYTFLWSSGGTDSVETNLTDGTYTVWVSDALGCSDTLQIDIETYPELNIYPILSHAVCYTDSGSAELFILGGVSPYSVNWFGVDSTHIPSGNHQILVTDASGCQKEVDFTILSEDELSIDLDLQIINCESNIYRASADISGGSPPYTLSWSMLNPDSISAGTHQLQVSDSLGCEIVQEFDIESISDLEINYTYPDINCDQEEVEVTLVLSGGAEPYAIEWSDGALNLYTRTVDVSSAPYVLVSDERLCEDTVFFEFNTISELNVELDIEHETCYAENGTLNLKTSGGLGNYVYQLNGTTFYINQMKALKSGSYELTVSDGSGCDFDTTFVIENEGGFNLLNHSITHELCEKDSTGSIFVKFDTQDLSYSWSTGSTTNGITNVTSGNYSLTVQDTFGCVWDTTFVVNAGSKILATTSDNFEPCSSETGYINVNPYGGKEPYTVVWSDGTETESLEIDSIGTYVYTIYDSNQCSNTYQYKVEGNVVGGNTCFKIPNAFSPNDDGINDKWKILGLDEFPNAQVQIFDRWGKRILNKTNYQSDWDGTLHGNALEMGSYIYIINLNYSGKPTFEGTVSINR
ncbi:MAG: gliding motility-associated C-terminal domain-containing protein [Flavobacteriales bacterium]